MMDNFKKKLKEKLPPSLLFLAPILLHPITYIEKLYLYYLIKVQPKRYEKIVERLKGKDRIKVAFFALSNSVWKYDYLYKLMVEHPRFEPVIVVCPTVNYGKENMLLEMAKCYDRFNNGYYNVVRTYNEKANTYLDVKKEINPDIIFYTNPYKGLIDDRYYITNFLDRLTCYAPYGYAMSNNENMLFNLPIHNLVWKNFYETSIHKQMAAKYALNKGANVIVSGYLLFDEFKQIEQNIFCTDKLKKKVIIYAPHHSIENDSEHLGYTCFLELADFFLELKEIYKNQIYWFFKPHPILRMKLYNHPDWGKNKTDEYYSKWSNSTNSELCEGNYVELFLKSDAMILDSISFIAEYYYTCNPSLFLVKDDTINKKFNDFGRMAYKLQYKAHSKESIVWFIEKVVCGGLDKMKTERCVFFNQVQKKDNVSLNILNHIIKELS